ncbi:MAG: hypothetical protein QOK09_1731 [Mycobacterium sp.]|jgi:hypothetical protein|nr:hypothetical protein [Mycobacterium sp.]
MKKYKPSPNRLHFGLSDECVMLRLSSDVRAPTWRKRNTYGGVHYRLNQERGPARNYPCIEDCGRRAADW